MPESLVSLFTATRNNLQGTDAPAVLSAFLDKPMDDISVRGLSIFFAIAASEPGISATDMLDKAVAKARDIEEPPVDNAELQQIADFTEANLGSIKDPIPRSLLQYLSHSLVTKGDYDTHFEATNHLLSTHKFE